MEVAILTAVGSAAAGAIVASWVWQRRCAEQRHQAQLLETELAQQQKMMQMMQSQLPQTFQSVAQEALRRTQSSFLDLAQERLRQVQTEMKGDMDGRARAVSDMVTPVRETLQKLDQRMVDLEKARVGAHEALKQQIETLAQSSHELRKEAHHLAHAMRQPQVRGRWGEMQLRRAVELGGMAEHCDFSVQTSTEQDGQRQRPDMLIHLPGGRHIVVDAKAPLSAYLEALDSPDESVRSDKMALHTRLVRDHIVALSRKSYWEQFQPSPELVVLFLPGESFLSAAVERDPLLLEGAVDQRVIVATPTTLIALLRAIAYGWRQENLSAKAQQVVQIGRQLSKRMADMLTHFSRVGRSLHTSVEAYNQSLGSLERRVVPSLRQLNACEGILDEIETPDSIEVAPRTDLAPVSERLAALSVNEGVTPLTSTAEIQSH
jgi:DNA recombination protein RmuC